MTSPGECCVFVYPKCLVCTSQFQQNFQEASWKQFALTSALCPSAAPICCAHLLLLFVKKVRHWCATAPHSKDPSFKNCNIHTLKHYYVGMTTARMMFLGPRLTQFTSFGCPFFCTAQSSSISTPDFAAFSPSFCRAAKEMFAWPSKEYTKRVQWRRNKKRK